MTPLARTIITLGICLFTIGTLTWIYTGNWQWFAGGGAIFFGTILAGGILSVEVKNDNGHGNGHSRQNNHTQTYQEPPTLHDHDPFSS